LRLFFNISPQINTHTFRNPQAYILKEFLKNSKKIPKEFQKNFKRILMEFSKNFKRLSKKNSQQIPKEFQKIPNNSKTPKRRHYRENPKIIS
jgi:mRNA-degrading endonuclease RelE of RelBE toxin-antitoxin system